MFTDCEKALLERAFLVREAQTEQQRATMRTEFEVNWPALVAYIKHAEARGGYMRGEVLAALGEGHGGPPLENLVWYILDRAVEMKAMSLPRH